MFQHISAVVLFVEDFERSLAFYRDKLGLPVAQLEPKFVAFKMRDQNFAVIDLADGAKMVNVDVARFEPQTGRVDRVMLCAEVDDVDAAYATLTERGVTFTQAPVDQYWGIRCAYFLDPEGNIWEISHPIAEQAA